MVSTSTLPPEIWLHIFMFATWTPGILEPDIYSVSDWSHPLFSRNQLQLLRTSLLTKRNLVRVCRLWNTLASPYLYETVVIRRARAVESLCQSVVESKRRAESSGERPAGWWTKRLDLAIRDHNYVYPQHFDFLADVIKHFPNLAILHVDSPRLSHMPSPVVSALAEACGPSLRVAAWSSWGLNLEFSDWKGLAAAAPNLRIIQVMMASSFQIRRPSGEELADFPVLSALTTIVAPSRHYGEELFSIYKNRCPSLREVEFSYDFRLITLQDSFFRIHGQNLTAVTLHCYYSSTLQADARVLGSSCPNLQSLTLGFGAWSYFRPHIELLSITYLGLRCTELQASSSSFVPLFEGLVTLRAPALRVVRLTDHRNVVNLRDQHPKVLKAGLARLSSKNFCLEDDDGHPLNSTVML